MLEPVLNDLLTDLRGLVNSARAKAAVSINSELVMLYWHIGKRLNLEFSATRPTYGEQVLQVVAKSLTAEFGHGFSKSSLSRATRFYEICPEEKIVATVWQQLSWSHILQQPHVAHSESQSDTLPRSRCSI